MGCDIHAHFEILVDREWLHYSQPDICRSYKLFEKMAGVRGDMKNAISPPRGIPENVSKTVLLDVDFWNGDGHSHSYLNAEEISVIVNFYNKLTDKYYEDEGWGYLFGSTWDDFSKGDHDFVDDIRLIFWFDN